MTGTPDTITPAMRAGTKLADQCSFALGFVCGQLDLEPEDVSLIMQDALFDVVREQDATRPKPCWRSLAGVLPQRATFHDSLVMAMPDAPPGVGILALGQLIGTITFVDEHIGWTSHHRDGVRHVVHPRVIDTRRRFDA